MPIGEETEAQVQLRERCLPKKKIIVDIGRSGLGNRIFSIVSAALLATQMDRVLDIRWKISNSCGDSYEHLFALPGGKKFVDEMTFKPFIYWGENHVFNTAELNRQVCEIHFTQFIDFHRPTDKPFQQLNILRDDDLLERTNELCENIYLESNIYYGHLLSHKRYKNGNIFKYFPNAFQDLSNYLFTPSKIIMAQANKTIKQMKGKNWMSIQAREKFTGGLGDPDGAMERSFMCANKLLQEGHISYVFFAADSAHLRDMAREYISDPSVLVEIPSNLQLATEYDKSQRVVHEDADYEKDNLNIRDREGMHVAVLEWYLTGEATYCMSPSIYHSTFSKSAVNRGKCKYISYHAGGECDVVRPQEHEVLNPLKDKTILLYTKQVTKELTVEIPEVDSDVVWESVKKHREIDKEQCTTDSDKSKRGRIDADGVIPDFWEAATALGRDDRARSDDDEEDEDEDENEDRNDGGVDRHLRMR